MSRATATPPLTSKPRCPQEAAGLQGWGTWRSRRLVVIEGWIKRKASPTKDEER